ncbi:MAG: hypothetical protein WCY19_05630 [Candidatus Gastranaerophilaceae bacterium]
MAREVYLDLDVNGNRGQQKPQGVHVGLNFLSSLFGGGFGRCGFGNFGFNNFSSGNSCFDGGYGNNFYGGYGNNFYGGYGNNFYGGFDNSDGFSGYGGFNDFGYGNFGGFEGRGGHRRGRYMPQSEGFFGQMFAGLLGGFLGGFLGNKLAHRKEAAQTQTQAQAPVAPAPAPAPAPILTPAPKHEAPTPIRDYNIEELAPKSGIDNKPSENLKMRHSDAKDIALGTEPAERSQRQELRDLRITRKAYKKAEAGDKDASREEFNKEVSDVKELVRTKEDEIIGLDKTIANSDKIINNSNDKIVEMGEKIDAKEYAIFENTARTDQLTARAELEPLKDRFTAQTPEAKKAKENAKQAKADAEAKKEQITQEITHLNKKLGKAQGKFDKITAADEAQKAEQARQTKELIQSIKARRAEEAKQAEAARQKEMDKQSAILPKNLEGIFTVPQWLNLTDEQRQNYLPEQTKAPQKTTGERKIAPSIYN